MFIFETFVGRILNFTSARGCSMFSVYCLVFSFHVRKHEIIIQKGSFITDIEQKKTLNKTLSKRYKAQQVGPSKDFLTKEDFRTNVKYSI